MKSKKISAFIAASAFLAALGSNAFADDKYVGQLGSNWQDHVTSTKSRAQVIAELEQARAQGLVVGGEEHFYPKQPSATTKSRAQVIAELEQARANGLLVGADPFYPQQLFVEPTERSRAEVRSEVNKATQNRGSNPNDLYFGG